MSAIIREERIGDCRLIQGDCLAVMPELGRFDAVVTSPPYDGLRDYGDDFHGFDGVAAIREVVRTVSEGGVCVWNVADQTVNGSESGNSFRQALAAIDAGMKLHDTMIYCKEGVTYPDSNRYLPCFEYMFVLSNGSPLVFNGIKDRPNKHAGSKMHGTDRNKNGTVKKISGMGRRIPSQGLRRNWWVISNPYTGETKGHPAPMPYALASGHIETWTNEGATILDPFAGSGTTGVACVKLGRKFTGIELDKDYFDIACKRIEEAYSQPDMFVDADKHPEPVQEGFEL